jgi:hypothetical protein
VILLIAVIAAVLTPNTPRGLLDPNGVDSNGSRALATLLRDNGVDVRRVTTADAALAESGPDSTLLIALPDRMSLADLRRLATAAADLIVIAADDDDLRALGLPLSTRGIAAVKTRAPACPLNAAVLAGRSDIGGFRYASVRATQTIVCYPASQGPTLVQLPDRARLVTVLGTGAPLTNDRLGHHGNAALAMNVLGVHKTLVWLIPEPTSASTTPGQKSLISLLPHRLDLAVAQLAIAVALFALWRARRLGRVVVEPLPVVVRAAETVEGRARLYRASRSRDRAADALRAASRRRIGAALGVPASAEPETVLDAVAVRCARPAGDVRALLYGSAPATDDALVQLAADLDHLEREVLTR